MKGEGGRGQGQGQGQGRGQGQGQEAGTGTGGRDRDRDGGQGRGHYHQQPWAAFMNSMSSWSMVPEWSRSAPLHQLFSVLQPPVNSSLAVLNRSRSA